MISRSVFTVKRLILLPVISCQFFGEHLSPNNKQTNKLRGLSPQANYTETVFRNTFLSTVMNQYYYQHLKGLAGGLGNQGLIPARVKGFSLCHHIHISCVAHQFRSR
jgi:hypothetical protein